MQLQAIGKLAGRIGRRAALQQRIVDRGRREKLWVENGKEWGGGGGKHWEWSRARWIEFSQVGVALSSSDAILRRVAGGAEHTQGG